MKNKSRTDSCRPLFEELAILPLPCVYTMEVLLFVKSNIKYFCLNADFHTYETRLRTNLRDSAHRMALYERSARSVGVALYNVLPAELKLLPMAEFKKRINQILQQNVFYSKDEYFSYFNNVG